MGRRDKRRKRTKATRRATAGEREIVRLGLDVRTEPRPRRSLRLTTRGAAEMMFECERGVVALPRQLAVLPGGRSDD